MNNFINLDYIDIREVLDDLGIFYTETGKNVSTGWIGVTCPFPGCDDVSNHLGLCLDSPVVSCFKCGQKGNYLTYLTHELGSFTKAKAIIEKHQPIELKKKKDKKEENVLTVSLPKNSSRKMLEKHAKFLTYRKFNYKYLHKKYNLYYCNDDWEWEDRIIVPIYQNNRLITFTSIDIEKDSNLRYKHCKREESIIPVKQHLIGIENTNKNTIVVVEGLLDKYRIGDGAVCTSGTQFTKEQVQILSDFQRVIILFDGDNAGRVAAKRLSNLLSPFTEVIRIDLPGGIDPDTMNKKDLIEIQEMIKF